MAGDYLDTADVWTILDLIVAEFTSDARSTQCFDQRVVQRAIALRDAHRQQGQQVRWDPSIDTLNRFGVSKYGGHIMLLRPPLPEQLLTKSEAQVLAAWLAALAGPERFASVLKAVVHAQ